MRDIGNEFAPDGLETFHGSDVMENDHSAERSALWSGIQTARINFEVLGRVTLADRPLKGNLDLPGNSIEERSLNGLLKLVVKEDFHHRTINRGLLQLKHPLK
jgi:hypothetical protein